jgi:hypothetical protein
VSEPPELRRDAERLAEQARRLGATFLLTEVSTGHAMLDTIETSADRDADGRRRSLALEAYNVVTERLARTGDQAPVLTGAERDQITLRLEELRLRLEHDAKRRGKG